jgi:hypothetical protein
MMRTDDHAPKRFTFATSPLATPFFNATVVVDQLLESDWPIIEVGPRRWLRDANREATTTNVNLPVRAAFLATTQLYIRAAVQCLESVVEAPGIVVPDFHAIGKTVTLARRSGHTTDGTESDGRVQMSMARTGYSDRLSITPPASEAPPSL